MTPHPAVDLVTGSAALVLQKRPVVPLSSWLVDAVVACGDAGLPLQIVTPPKARLTMPLSLLLRPPFLRWVVAHPDCYYDGLTGEELSFVEGQFVPDGGRAEAFDRVSDGTNGTHLLVHFRVRHPAAESTRIGTAIDAVYRKLTGASPAAWGPSEPIARPWSPAAITELCRERAPRATRICHAGLGDVPAIGTARISRHGEGIDEDAAVHVGYAAGLWPPISALPALAGELAAAYDLVDLQVTARRGREDLTAVPVRTGRPVPVGLALGRRSVREVGTDRALGVHGLSPLRLGDERAPGVWYPLGDGRTTAAWPLLEDLLKYLRPGERQADPESLP